MMQLTRRQTIVLAIALAVLVALTLFLAPSGGNLQQQGSTYSRSPDGYGAWFDFMDQRRTPVQRWNQPLPIIVYTMSPIGGSDWISIPPSPPGPQTFIRISNGLETPSFQIDWVKIGNTMVLLGVNPPATQAPFTSDVNSPVGKVRIQTSRRGAIAGKTELRTNLQDSYGAVVWTEKIGKGMVIYASTPYLAANAYQDFPANFKFLAELVTQPGHPIWVDEYMHGHQNPPIKDEAGNPIQGERSLFTYLLQTPLSLLAIQSLVVLLVVLWGQNRRLGPPDLRPTPIQDNSEAYIQALAEVLHKAECSDFVLATLGKAEQLDIQKALGLGTNPLPLDTLAEAWERQTGQSSESLPALLQTASHPRRLSEADLLRWVDQMQIVKRELSVERKR
jgi:hypothetical protein